MKPTRVFAIARDQRGFFYANSCQMDSLADEGIFSRWLTVAPEVGKLKRMSFWRCILFSLGLLCSPLAVHAQQQMRVPFNFQWGESAGRVEQSLSASKAKIVGRKVVDGRTVFTVEGIPQKQLQRALFYFRNDMLNEIELHFGESSWDTAKYELFFEDVRRNVDSKYGIGRLLTRTRSREGDIMQTLAGYQWMQGGIALRLYLFTAEKDTNATRVLSLHYKET
jgi:hypothetical protein